MDSSGRVTVADQAAFEPQSAFLTEGVTGAAAPFPELWLPAGVSVHQLQGKIARLPAIAAIKARLRAEGLLVSPARTAMVVMVSLTLWAALFVTGGLRLAEGSHNHRPINDLQSLVILSALVCFFTLIASWRRLANLTTFRGAGLLRRLRSAERQSDKEAARLSRAARRPSLPDWRETASDSARESSRRRCSVSRSPASPPSRTSQCGRRC